MSIQEINRIKNHYPAGTRIELISMNDPFAPVPSGMKGSVGKEDAVWWTATCVCGDNRILAEYLI